MDKGEVLEPEKFDAPFEEEATEPPKREKDTKFENKIKTLEEENEMLKTALNIILGE